MRQLVFAGQGRVEWREVPAPRIQSDLAALVRPLVLGRCDLDTAFVRELVPLAAGEPVGHEMIGEVVEIGAAVRGVRPGQRVLVSAQICCGVCRNCRRGSTGRCQSVPFAASFGMGRAGAFGSLGQDLALIPYADAMLAPLPDGADPVALIGAADMATDAWRAVGPPLAQRPGASVLVMGGLAGVIGLYAAGLAAALGAGRVVYVDDDAARLALAARFGVEVQEAPCELASEFEVVVDACGDKDRLVQALRAAEPEAIVTSVVIHLGAETGLPLQEMYGKGVTFVTGRPNCRPGFEPVLAQCLHGRFEPQRVEQRLYRLDEAPEAWMDAGVRTVAVAPELFA